MITLKIPNSRDTDETFDLPISPELHSFFEGEATRVHAKSPDSPAPTATDMLMEWMPTPPLPKRMSPEDWIEPDHLWFRFPFQLRVEWHIDLMERTIRQFELRLLDERKDKMRALDHLKVTDLADHDAYVRKYYKEMLTRASYSRMEEWDFLSLYETLRYPKEAGDVPISQPIPRPARFADNPCTASMASIIGT